MNSPLSPEFQAILDASRARSAERMARLTGKAPVAGSLVAQPRTAESWRPTGKGAQPAFGALRIDRLTTDEAEAASNKSGKAGLKAYMALWGRSL